MGKEEVGYGMVHMRLARTSVTLGSSGSCCGKWGATTQFDCDSATARSDVPTTTTTTTTTTLTAHCFETNMRVSLMNNQNRLLCEALYCHDAVCNASAWQAVALTLRVDGWLRAISEQRYVVWARLLEGEPDAYDALDAMTT